MNIRKKIGTQIETRLADALARIKNLGPVTRQVGQFALREAQRRVKSDSGRLRRSLNVKLLSDSAFAIASAEPHAAIQNYGGTILPGGMSGSPSARLNARMLIVPMSQAAKSLLKMMGASHSLRDAPIPMFVLKTDHGLYLVRNLEKSFRGKQRDGRGRKLRHILGGTIEFMFKLIPRATIAAQKYTPELSEAVMQSAIARAMNRYVMEGRG